MPINSRIRLSVAALCLGAICASGSTAISPVHAEDPVIEKVSDNTTVEKEPISFEKRTEKTDDLPAGTKVVIQKGVNGEKSSISEKVNGIDYIRTEITKAPKAEVTLIGTGEVISGIDQKIIKNESKIRAEEEKKKSEEEERQREEAARNIKTDEEFVKSADSENVSAPTQQSPTKNGNRSMNTDSSSPKVETKNYEAKSDLSTCKASFYSYNLHGGPTASGEKFNMYDMTAAHKTLPLGTKIEVINKANGQSVIVRINDRGPYIKGRCVDLSPAAMKQIGGINAGVITVDWRIVEEK